MPISTKMAGGVHDYRKTEGPIVMFTILKRGLQERNRKKDPTGESAAFCDIDNDSDLDIAVGSEETSKYVGRIYRN